MKRAVDNSKQTETRSSSKEPQVEHHVWVGGGDPKSVSVPNCFLFRKRKDKSAGFNFRTGKTIEQVVARGGWWGRGGHPSDKREESGCVLTQLLKEKLRSLHRGLRHSHSLTDSKPKRADPRWILKPHEDANNKLTVSAMRVRGRGLGATGGVGPKGARTCSIREKP